MVRIIPRLDIKGPNLVKGIHLEGLRVLGSPEKFAEYYYKNGADELMYMDIVASLYGRNSLIDIIKKTAAKIFIPMTVGGGLRTLEDIKNALRAGADKVSINTMAIKNPEIIKEAAKKFGSSTVVVSIEAIKQPSGEYHAFIENGRQATNVEVFSWAKRVEQLGAGEILLTSVDREGTGMGYDTELTKRVAESVSIPVIANGGAGGAKDVEKVIKDGKADAVALASVLHYDFLENNFHKYPTGKREGNTEFLKNGKTFSKVKISSLPEIKQHLLKQGINCRQN